MTKVLRRFLLLAKAPLLSLTPRPHLTTIITPATITTTPSLPGLEAQHPMLANPTWLFLHTGWEHRRRGARQAHSLLLNNNN